MSRDQSSGDSSDSDIESDEEQIMNMIEKTRKQLANDPTNYDAHVNLIKLLRNQGELDDLRVARENMSSIYPLSSELWMAWLQDEMKLVTDVEERKRVEKLFERASNDYEDVNIWLEACHFAIDGMATEQTLQEGSDTTDSQFDHVRKIYENALARQGLNVATGAILWEVAREFEMIVLAQIQRHLAAASVGGEASDKIEVLSNRLQSQLKRIDRLYRRQLSMPSINGKETFDAYVDFLNGLGGTLDAVGPSKQPDEDMDSSIHSRQPIPDVTQAYNRANARLNAMLHFEKMLESLDEHLDVDSLVKEGSSNDRESVLLSIWSVYLDWAVSASRKKAYTGPPPLALSGQTRDDAKVAVQLPSATQDHCKLLPSEVICLMERAVTALCLHECIWLRFVDFLEADVSSDIDRLVRVLRRSVRNSPWSLGLWLRLGLAMELLAETSPNPVINGITLDAESTHFGVSNVSVFSQVEEVFEEALANPALAASGSPGTLISLWFGFIDFRVRRYLAACQSTKDGAQDKALLSRSLELVRDTFERAISHVQNCFGPCGDNDGSLFKRWAYFEACHVRDLPRARAIWVRLMQIGHNGRRGDLWIDQINFERDLALFLSGQTSGFPANPSTSVVLADSDNDCIQFKHLLRVCSMAINSVSPEVGPSELSISPALVFVSANRALVETGLSLPRLREFLVKLHARCRQLGIPSPPASLASPAADVIGGYAEKRMLPKPMDDGVELYKSFKPTDKLNNELLQTSHKPLMRPSQIKKRRMDSASDNEAGPNQAKRPSKEVSLQPSPVVRPSAETNAINKSTACRSIKAGHDEKPLHGQSIVHDSSKDDRTVFVSNLAYSITEATLREIFEKCGKLASIRLVLNYCGRSKGYAYVEFAHPASVNEALKLDRSFISDLDKKHDADVCENTLDQRPMFVSICDTTGKMRGPTAFSFSGGLEPNKLFVKNLDKKYGQLVDVRISTFRDGSPKGHAYIEFLTPDEASRALVATDGLLVGDSMLSVAISNPPPRIPQKNRTDFSSTTKSNQIESKKREYMHSRTKLSLGNEKLGPKGQPDRVEFRPSEDLASSALERASFDSKSSKTNQDFRKFFLDLK